MKKILSWITMKRLNCEFVDQVSGQEIFKYVDCYGNYYLAERNRFFFRVITTSKEQEK